MEESSTYQAILEEGREQGREEARTEGRAKGKVKEARKLLLLLGNKRFGPPDATTQTALEAIMEVERLETLVERTLDVESWQELLR